MPKVKATRTSRFPKQFEINPNKKFYFNLCSCVVSCNKRLFVESHQNASKHQKALGSRSKLHIAHTLQTLLWFVNFFVEQSRLWCRHFKKVSAIFEKRHHSFGSSNTDFVEKVTKAFLSADIPWYKLNNKHIKNLFHDTGHSLPPDTTCRKTVVQLRADELERIKNVVRVHDTQLFLVVDRQTLCKVIPTSYMKIRERRTFVGEKDRRLVEFVGDQSPSSKPPPRSKREREERPKEMLWKAR